ncbi:hypothetical protein PMIN01_11250 [Paraphaeosphaeria minitans]|uniref:Uncharacterized protein n=1 Tax=Paraphaeosphaeria minitans TaxID=565426 RepID=A0A9P6G855_9PLEO|nr:hypothetical protein PMIN01_11250 [Paraphaeosphaeria minitans]
MVILRSKIESIESALDSTQIRYPTRPKVARRVRGQTSRCPIMQSTLHVSTAAEHTVESQDSVSDCNNTNLVFARSTWIHGITQRV